MSKDSEGRGLLMLACYYGANEIVNELLTTDICEKHDDYSNNGYNALHWATVAEIDKTRKYRIIEALLEAGFDSESRTKSDDPKSSRELAISLRKTAQSRTTEALIIAYQRGKYK